MRSLGRAQPTEFNTIKLYEATVIRQDFGYTVEIIENKPDGSEVRASCPLLDLGYSKAAEIAKFIEQACDVHITLDTKESLQKRIESYEGAIKTNQRQMKKLEQEVAKLKAQAEKFEQTIALKLPLIAI